MVRDSDAVRHVTVNGITERARMLDISKKITLGQQLHPKIFLGLTRQQRRGRSVSASGAFEGPQRLGREHLVAAKNVTPDPFCGLNGAAQAWA